MVRLNHAGLVGHVLGAFHFVTDTQEHLAQPQGAAAPVNVDEAITRLEWQKRRDKKLRLHHSNELVPSSR
jgi:hypothetical protein